MIGFRPKVRPRLLNNAARRDPARIRGTQTRLIREFTRRYVELNRAIATSIIANDVFGLAELVRGIPRSSSFATLVAPIPTGAFKFETTQKKIDGFMAWLHEQHQGGILDVLHKAETHASVVTPAWSGVYIDSYYQKAMREAYEKGIKDGRYELGKAGFGTAAMQTGPLSIYMQMPIHADRVGLIYSRTYEDLKSVTQATEAQVRRMISEGLTSGLARGMAEGRSPYDIGRRLVADVQNKVNTIGLARATLIARTETARAHHVAAIAEYRQAAAAGVEVKAELLTSGLANVCPICLDLEKGGPYTLDQIEFLIPVHPCCACTSVPLLKMPVEKEAATPPRLEPEATETAEVPMPRIEEIVSTAERIAVIPEEAKVTAGVLPEGIPLSEEGIDIGAKAARTALSDKRWDEAMARVASRGGVEPVWNGDALKWELPKIQAPWEEAVNVEASMKSMMAKGSLATREEIAAQLYEREIVLTKLSEEAGIPVQELKERFTKILTDYAEKAAPTIRSHPGAAQAILSDGEMKTMFETGKSSGLLDKGVRRKAENVMLDVKVRAAGSDRPIYGYMAHPTNVGLEEHYGVVRFELNRDVMARSTITAGDSLPMGYLPTPASSPNYLSFDRYTFQREGHGMLLDQAVAEQQISRVYMELQVQGGVRLSDISRVIIEESKANATAKRAIPALIKDLEAKGIPYVVI